MEPGGPRADTWIHHCYNLEQREYYWVLTTPGLVTCLCVCSIFNIFRFLLVSPVHKLKSCFDVMAGGIFIIWSRSISWGFGSSSFGFLLLHGKYHEMCSYTLIFLCSFSFWCSIFLCSWQRYCPLPLYYSSCGNFLPSVYQRNTTLFVRRFWHVMLRNPERPNFPRIMFVTERTVIFEHGFERYFVILAPWLYDIRVPRC